MTPSNSVANSETRRYTIGPTVEISLTDRIAVNVNPLYRRAGSSASLFSSFSDVAIPYESVRSIWRTRAHSLELPVIGKYYFGDSRRLWRPFAGAGFSFQTAWQSIQGFTAMRDRDTDIVRTNFFNTDQRTATDAGAVFNTGIILKRGRFQFAPEIRYTRWGSASPVRGRHQADALFSIRF
jgi:hypothetical protein